MKDLNPVIERVILRCLENEPSARPANVFSVAAALPGGDPLAAAIAAGETPSPQLVAASGESAGLRPRTAVICLAAVLLGLALVTYFSVHYSALEKMGLEQTPEVLTQKSHEIIARLGYGGRPADSAFGLSDDGDFQDYVEKNDKPPHWDEVLAARPSLLQYWYRQSPDALVANDFRDNLLTPGIVTKSDPPTVLSGMINLVLDPQGRLTYFQAIPPQRTRRGGRSCRRAGCGIRLEYSFSPQPVWIHRNYSPRSPPGIRWLLPTCAWHGLEAGRGLMRPMRVEAAAFQGKPVFFSLIGDWTKPERVKSTQKKSVGEKANSIIQAVVFCALLVGSVFLARRNYRQGRGDRAGALRLAGVMFLLEMGLWLCRCHFATISDTIGLFVLCGQHGTVHFGRDLDAVPGGGTVGEAALADNHDLLEPVAFRTRARSAGGPGHSFRRASGSGLDSYLPDSLHPHDAHGGCAWCCFQPTP